MAAIASGFGSTPRSSTDRLIDLGDCRSSERATDTLTRKAHAWAAFAGPIYQGASQCLMSVGAFVTTTGHLAGPVAYKMAGPVIGAAGAVMTAVQLLKSSAGGQEKAAAILSSLSLAGGSALYQWSLLGGPATIGAVGFGLLLGGAGYQLWSMGQRLSAADTSAAPLPISNRQLSRWQPWMNVVSVGAIAGGAWLGCTGLYTSSEFLRCAGETCMVLGIVASGLFNAVAAGRLKAATEQSSPLP